VCTGDAGTHPEAAAARFFDTAPEWRLGGGRSEAHHDNGKEVRRQGREWRNGSGVIFSAERKWRRKRRCFCDGRRLGCEEGLARIHRGCATLELCGEKSGVDERVVVGVASERAELGERAPRVSVGCRL
jgi:hypothetical protein